MDEEQFEPRLGTMRASPSRRGRKYLYAVLVACARAGGPKRSGVRRLDGSRIARGSATARLLASRDRYAGFRARRAIVKTRLVRLGGKGIAAARAHLRYVQRDGVTSEGEPGKLYSWREEDVDGKAFLERREGARHQFGFIVSAEDGVEYDDLKPLIRRFMTRMEQDLGTALDWVAVDHLDTLHPHTHIMLRGRDERGENLVIAPEYISGGMRERVAELVSLDLGPRTDLEIERRLRLDVEAERLTATDRRLVRQADPGRIVAVAGRDMFDHSVRAGRLRKLDALGLAEDLGGGRWRLSPNLERDLLRLGERGDIILTMQRALAAEKVERAAADRVVFDPAAGRDLVGRVLSRGLADEVRDRHYLIVDGTDGRTHYVDIGAADAVEPIAAGSVVRVTGRPGSVRKADHIIAEVAAAHEGRYSAELHRAYDARASEAFVEAHVRRLEAMRRGIGAPERRPDGSWDIGSDHLERVEAFEAHQQRSRPVAVELLSPLPIERLAEHDGATWLDGELTAKEPEKLRDAGFGHEVRSALATRRAWLLREGLASEEEGRTYFRSDMVAVLQRRELMRFAAQLRLETGKDFIEPSRGEAVEGRLRQRLDLASGRFAMVENSREFSLVPWRPVLERAIGRSVSGRVGEGGITWTIGRSRGREI